MSEKMIGRAMAIALGGLMAAGAWWWSIPACVMCGECHPDHMVVQYDGIRYVDQVVHYHQRCFDEGMAKDGAYSAWATDIAETIIAQDRKKSVAEKRRQRAARAMEQQ